MQRRSDAIALLRNTGVASPRERCLGDLASGRINERALENLECVIHLAGKAHVFDANSARSDREFHQTNVVGTRLLAEKAAAVGVRRFVFVSTIGVHGRFTLDKPFSVEDPPAPHDAYSRSKLEAEKALTDVAEKFGLELFIVRPPLVYGPNPTGNIARLVRMIRAGLPLPFGAVRNSRSLISASNLSDFLLFCASTDKVSGGTFLVSDDELVATPQLVRMLAAAMGRKSHLFSVPPRLLSLAFSLIGHSLDYERLCSSLEVDMAATRETLGWTPPLSMSAGIAESFAASSEA